jgi:EAL domain-containing protein (putative c-di-GMP-specific phosphodiesterase class I)
MTHITKPFQSPVSPEASRPRLLIVEDDENLARSMARVFDREGFAVTHAPDGVVASEALTSNTFDVVLSDINLPGISGVELLRLVRAYDLDVPVVLVTGNPTLETAAEAVELGALQYLTKPVELEALKASVVRALKLGRLARAKREALSHVQEHGVAAGDRAGLLVSFERALESMWMAFQPIVDTRHRHIFAYEALLRSREPSLPTPGAVLDAAERLDALHQLGRRVRELVAGTIEAATKTRATFFVNLHAADLLDVELLGDSAPLAPHAGRVVLEITERARMDSVQDLSRRIRALRDAGYSIAVDDLGAGYAGLVSFATLEPEFVKLDMSLVRDIHRSVTRQRIVHSLVSLCREMSMRVVAEGIEVQEELATVRALGCDLAQGYLLGKPEAHLAAAPLVSF